jgi:hypothetical protein
MCGVHVRQFTLCRQFVSLCLIAVCSAVSGQTKSNNGTKQAFPLQAFRAAGNLCIVTICRLIHQRRSNCRVTKGTCSRFSNNRRKKMSNELFVKNSKGFFCKFAGGSKCLEQSGRDSCDPVHTVTVWPCVRCAAVAGCSNTDTLLAQALLTTQQNCRTSLATRTHFNMDLCGTNNFARFEVFTRYS